MRAVWLADVIADTGLEVKPYPGWETRGRDDLEPVGLMWHHTVTRPTTPDDIVDRMLALTGSSTVPAPLANYSTNRDGTVSIIAAGKANHAGAGSWHGVRGNAFYIGDEMKNYGTAVREPWPARQLDAARIAAAAVLAYIDGDVAMLCGHKEYATPAGRKSDPHTLDMDRERLLVRTLMEAPMGWKKPGDKVDDLVDADQVFAYQGTAFAGNNVATYLMGVEELEARRGMLLGFARIVDTLMVHDQRLRTGGH